MGKKGQVSVSTGYDWCYCFKFGAFNVGILFCCFCFGQIYDSEASKHTKDVEIPQGWPQKGAITFKDYKMKYRKNTPIVLNGLSFVIKAGEKLGIVGRTGSGENNE